MPMPHAVHNTVEVAEFIVELTQRAPMKDRIVDLGRALHRPMAGLTPRTRCGIGADRQTRRLAKIPSKLEYCRASPTFKREPTNVAERTLRC